jgi:hypothetical protein
MWRRTIARTAAAAIFLLAAVFSRALAAEAPSETPASTLAGATAGLSIPPGTEITLHNWKSYKQYMPDGMVRLFRGELPFTMTDDVKIVVGPTLFRPLPKTYLEATEKYAPQVKIVELGNGGLSLSGYQGGRPFPDPQEPHKGWKILANLWYRYLPHLIVDTYASVCTQNSVGSIACAADEVVNRQLSYNTDPGIPPAAPEAQGKFYTQWVMKLEPEQEKYNTTLTISYADLTKAEETFAFAPSLRRYLPVAAAGRCVQAGGLDAAADDYRYGFDSNLTQIQVEYLGQRQILGLVDANLNQGKYPDSFAMPIGWPQPDWGKWQVRDVDMLTVTKLPQFSSSYCYGKRVMYVDKAFSAPLWEDLYDSDMKLWKFLSLFYRTLEVPGVGPVNASGSQVEIFWDVQNHHSTVFSEPAPGRPFYLNEQAPTDFNDLGRYTTTAGLNEILH